MSGIRVIRSLNGATGTGAGAEVHPSGGETHASVVVTGITVATVQFQGSNDGTNWVQIGSNITADGTEVLPPGAIYARYRAEVTAYTSGTINADIAIG